jgi:hypothetical protein
MKQTPLQRIQRVMNFYYKRGCNKESVNRMYYKILKPRYEKIYNKCAKD